MPLTEIDRQIRHLLQQRSLIVGEMLRNDPSLSLPAAIADVEQVVIDGLVSSGTGSSGTGSSGTGSSGTGSTVPLTMQNEVMRHIVSICFQASRPRRVAFLGPVDSYSHLALLAYFGDAIALSPVASIGAVFDSVLAGQQRDRGGCQFGIVPIENSTDGRIVDTLGRLAIGEVNLIGEVLMSIHHNLLSNSPIEQITEVHSKPQALSQCRRWLADHLPRATLIETASTTAAAEAAASMPGVAAVASLPAATRYALKVVETSIEDNPNNVTRFAVLGSKMPAPTGRDKTTLLFQVEHRPGALADVMMIFKQARLNLTWIESFPEPGKPNEYFFIVEFPGHRDDSDVADAIATLSNETRHVRVLGSYACGRRI